MLSIIGQRGKASGLSGLASFPGSPSFRAIIPRMTFAFPSGGSKVIRGIIARKEGEPGNEASLVVCLSVCQHLKSTKSTIHNFRYLDYNNIIQAVKKPPTLWTVHDKRVSRQSIPSF